MVRGPHRDERALRLCGPRMLGGGPAHFTDEERA